jgi:hypothetical protein
MEVVVADSVANKAATGVDKEDMAVVDVVPALGTYFPETSLNAPNFWTLFQTPY